MMRSEKNKQFGEVFTPDYFVDQMIEESGPHDFTKKYLDLCAGHAQFADGLIRYFSKFKDFDKEYFINNNLYFCEIQKESCDIISSKYNSKNIYNISYENINDKFDVVFSNPPFNNNKHLKIFNDIVEKQLSTKYVIIHPASWLLDLKHKKISYNKFKNNIYKHLKSVKIFNGNPVFNIGLFVPCVITHIDTSKEFDNIQVDYFGDKYTVDDINDITKYGKEWITVVSDFYKTVKHYINENESIWSHNVKSLTNDMTYCQIAAIRGHVNLKDENSIFSDDFYTLVLKDTNVNKGIRKAVDKNNITPTFEFSSDIERDNFLNYLKTDFVRFCLSIYKIGANLDRGEMEIIPWLDFTESWDDDKLFKYFNINQETQDYIRKFLPDYYNIR